jgi:hypothetical protein
MQMYEENNMSSGDAVSTQQEENFLRSAVSEQPTRPERSRQLSKPLKRLRTVPLASSENPSRERRQRVARTGTRQYGAAIWSPYGDSASSTVEAVVEQREFPGGDTGETFEMAEGSEIATSWEWIYDGGDDGSDGHDDFEASANAEGYHGTPAYPQTGPLPIMLEPASRRAARERASGSHKASSMLPLLVTLLIIGVIGTMVCQYLLAFYR